MEKKNGATHFLPEAQPSAMGSRFVEMTASLVPSRQLVSGLGAPNNKIQSQTIGKFLCNTADKLVNSENRQTDNSTNNKQ